MPLTLTVIDGPHTGRTFEFTGHDAFLVGRSRKAHFRLAERDKYFSRQHFLIEVNPPLCRLTDMNSRNGTYVNGTRVQAAELKSGDVIKAGHTLLRVEQLEPDEDDVVTPMAVSVPASDRPDFALDPDPPPPEPTDEVAALPPGPGDSDPNPESIPPAPPRQVTPALPPRARPGCPVCGSPRDGSGAPWLCAVCSGQAQARPQPVPGYRVVKEIGRGTMGVVWLAVRDADGALVALKTVVPAVQASGVQVERFLREARILASLDHPHIVRCYDTGEASGRLFFAMEYVEGTDVRTLLQRSPEPWPVKSATRLVCQVLAGLGHAHRRGIVHRDIKPANLLIGRAGGRKASKIADFGLARVYRQTQMSGLTMTGEVGGTPNYMPPEQITSYREARPPADQYSTAATFYHLLTGRTLYDLPPPPACFVLILEGRPKPLLQLRPDVPQKLAIAVHRALAPDPADRFASVDEFRKAITPFGQ